MKPLRVLSVLTAQTSPLLAQWFGVVPRAIEEPHRQDQQSPSHTTVVADIARDMTSRTIEGKLVARV
jgi:hypothetical protein